MKITTNDGTEIYYKDWDAGQPVVFGHGWPLSAEAWDSQMLFLPAPGFRAIAGGMGGQKDGKHVWYAQDRFCYLLCQRP
jgi:non-heme chloroperoxidase